MASPQQKLADALEALEALQREGVVAVRSSDLSRTRRERLVRSGFLQPVIKGWYIPARPEEQAGASTAWYASFWDFCAGYLEQRFGDQWCLSAEQSLFLHTGKRTVPKQLLVRAPKGRNKPTNLPHRTSLFELRADMPAESSREILGGLRIYTLPAALVHSGAGLFTDNAAEARAALAMVADSSDVLAILLAGGHSTIAGRLAGAFRNIGREKISDEILGTMKSAGYSVRETDPFDTPAPFTVSARERSPYVSRLRLMWHDMRARIVPRFPAAPQKAADIASYIKRVDELYVTDAYHSLSIEGYRVSPELIERVRTGAWNPDRSDEAREQRNALAARGYFDAFGSVKTSVEKVLRSENPGTVAANDHAEWYRRLFAPSVTAGIVKMADLAGYRSGPVYIRNSLHVPPSREAVRDLMPLLFELLTDEPEPSVRAVLGHFVFVYIHPYFDGNGRIGRFLMNVMLASAGYPWTVIPVERRKKYMESLEAASVDGNIAPFTAFLGGLVRDQIDGRPRAKLPRG
ncbi:MAG: Fic family protein [Gammaproteobacteria bacterium]|nr:Fic family protein [Gammaproteobacteria bacterium]